MLVAPYRVAVRNGRAEYDGVTWLEMLLGGHCERVCVCERPG